MLPIQKMLISKNFTKGNFDKKYIVIHETDNDKPTAGAKNHYEYWNRDANAKASAHFIVDESNIIQLVELKDASFGTGKLYGESNVKDATMNNVINVEICVNGDYTKARQNAIDLTRHLVETTGLKVIRHFDCSAKHCPRKMMDNPRLWEDFLSQVHKKDKVDVATAQLSDKINKGKEYVGTKCMELQQKLNKAVNAGLVEDGKFGLNTYNALIKFQLENKLTVDGLAGKNTFTKLDEIIASKNKPKIDEEVLRVQKIMNRLKIANLIEDGAMGNNTKEAIKKFQTITRTTADGVIGQNTWYRINEILNKPFVDITHKSNTFAVMYIQWRVGVSNDGVFGIATQRAIKEWQRKSGLEADGMVGNNTWHKLIG